MWRIENPPAARAAPVSMGRHSKNNNDRAYFTYHERLAARKGYASSAFYKHTNGGYGGGELNIGSDSLRDFDMCCLSLHPCRDPVITQQGFLYEREVIYEYILAKRKENERALEAWNEQEASKAAAEAHKLEDAHARTVEAFERAEHGLAAAPAARRAADARGAKSVARGHVVNDDWSLHAKDSSFWAPQNAPTAVERVAKPDMAVLCPFSGAPLRLKQLYAVRFTPANEGEEAEAAGGSIDGTRASERYICPLSHKGLTNAVACAVLRPSGQVVTLECVNKLIKRDMLDPFCSPPAALKEHDIIPIRTEGTGYAARGSTEVKKLGAQALY